MFWLAGLFGLALAWLWFVAWRRQRVFVIQIDGQRVAVTQGQAPPTFVRDVGNICHLWSVTQGRVVGIRTPNGVTVKCQGEAARISTALQNALDHPLE